MKRWKKAWLERAVTPENMARAYMKAKKGTSKKNRGLAMYADPEERRKLGERLVKGLWAPLPSKRMTRTDRYSGKVRIIDAPAFETKLVEHMIVQTFETDIQDHLIRHTLASVPGRGIEYGRYLLKKAAMTGGRGVKWFVKCDLKRFFPSVDVDAAMALYAKHIPDVRMLSCMRMILGDGPGIPLGSYLSQWTANLVLTPLDQWVKTEKRVKKYFCYMDDRIAFFPSEKKARAFASELSVKTESMGYHVKEEGPGMIIIDKWSRRGINMLGYITSRSSKQKLRPGIYLAASRTMNRIEKKGSASRTQSRSLLSRRGFLVHSDCKKLRMRADGIIDKYRLKEAANA